MSPILNGQKAATAVTIFQELETIGLSPDKKKKYINDIKDYILSLERKVNSLWYNKCECGPYNVESTCIVCDARDERSFYSQSNSNP